MFGKDKAEEGGQAARSPVKATLDAKGAAPAKANVAPSLISADMKVVGNLHSAGDIQIDGTVEGDIKSRTVTIGEGAEIKGSIKAEQVRVGGRVSGKIEATQVRIAKTANVQGDITYKTLAIEEDAVLEGTCRRIDSAKPAAAEPKAPESRAPEAKVAPLKPAQPEAGEPKAAEPRAASAGGGAAGPRATGGGSGGSAVGGATRPGG